MIWWLAAVLGLWVLAVAERRWRRALRAPEQADELHWVPTDDGQRIALWRHRPAQGGGEPVLFVHGLGASHRNHDFDRRFGIAQTLKARGMDCWNIDLRGRGASSVPRRGWSFDDYVQRDLAGAVDYILDATGSRQVHWVGHSMGGMLYYAFAGAGGRSAKIASATTLASPVRFFRPRLFERWAVRRRGWLSRFGVIAGGNRWAAWFAAWARWLPRRWLLFQYNPDHTDPHLILRAAATAVAPISARELLQFADWIVHHRWTSEDGATDYRAGLDWVQAPTLVIAGAGDRLCPPFMVKFAYDRIAAADKHFVEAGRAAGMRHDYGHIDLVFGANAPEEIFPLIGDWIARHPAERGP